MLRLVFKLAVFIVFFGYGEVLTYRASKHIVGPYKTRWATIMLDASKFDDVGKQLRKNANIYYNVGILVLAAIFFLV